MDSSNNNFHNTKEKKKLTSKNAYFFRFVLRTAKKNICISVVLLEMVSLKGCEIRRVYMFQKHKITLRDRLMIAAGSFHQHLKHRCKVIPTLQCYGQILLPAIIWQTIVNKKQHKLL